MENIKRFLEVGHGYGSGFGYGYGDGSGPAPGFGLDDGSGYGSGYDFDDGSGYGYDSGSGYVYGYDFGYGDGSGIKKINGDIVYLIDSIPIIFSHVRGNAAKGFVVMDDLSLKSCWVVKQGDKFAHGETLKKAHFSLQEKIYKNLDIDEAISKFHAEFKKEMKYSAETFYMWHGILTSSCEFGRDVFMKNKNIKKTDKFTVDEFINLTKDEYGGDVILKLKL